MLPAPPAWRQRVQVLDGRAQMLAPLTEFTLTLFGDAVPLAQLGLPLIGRPFPLVGRPFPLSGLSGQPGAGAAVMRTTSPPARAGGAVPRPAA
jgi:hypothetical protein